MITLSPQNNSPEGDEKSLQPELRIGFILMNHFTLISVAGMVESLRFAADESFSSRQIFCQWEWMTCDNQPVVASCGLPVLPTATLDLDKHWDYIVIAGGLLEETRNPPDWLLDVIRQLHARKIALISLCSGAFVLGKAGLLDGRRCAIHFTTRNEFKSLFPLAIPVIDQNYIHDRGIITCPGGTAIDLATDLIRHHCGEVRAQKGLKYLLEDKARTIKVDPKKGTAHTGQDIYDNELVKRIIDYMNHHLDSPAPLHEVTEFIGINARQLNHAFVKSTGMTVAAYWRKIRLDQARKLMADSNYTINAIAAACGFSDASHLISWFNKQFGETPTAFRKRRRNVERLMKE